MPLPRSSSTWQQQSRNFRFIFVSCVLLAVFCSASSPSDNLEKSRRQMQGTQPDSTSNLTCRRTGEIDTDDSTTTPMITKMPPVLVEHKENIEHATILVPTQNTQKRQGYLTWDDYFLSVALLSSKRSKDPTSAAGACIVDKENRIVGRFCSEKRLVGAVLETCGLVESCPTFPLIFHILSVLASLDTRNRILWFSSWVLRLGISVE